MVYKTMKGCVYMIYSKDIERTKLDVEKYLGSKVKIRSNNGRKKMLTTEGILIDAYPSVFLVQHTNEKNMQRNLSYSYKDLLTNNVQITLI